MLKLLGIFCELLDSLASGILILGTLPFLMLFAKVVHINRSTNRIIVANRAASLGLSLPIDCAFRVAAGAPMIGATTLRPCSMHSLDSALTVGVIAGC